MTKGELRKVRKADEQYQGWKRPAGSGNRKTRKRAAERRRALARELASAHNTEGWKSSLERFSNDAS